VVVVLEVIEPQQNLVLKQISFIQLQLVLVLAPMDLRLEATQYLILLLPTVVVEVDLLQPVTVKLEALVVVLDTLDPTLLAAEALVTPQQQSQLRALLVETELIPQLLLALVVEVQVVLEEMLLEQQEEMVE
jgi:hypothetical protein